MSTVLTGRNAAGVVVSFAAYRFLGILGANLGVFGGHRLEELGKFSTPPASNNTSELDGVRIEDLLCVGLYESTLKSSIPNYTCGAFMFLYISFAAPAPAATAPTAAVADAATLPHSFALS